MASCTNEQIKQAVASWAGLPPFDIADDTELDGLGGKSWPQDAQPLITSLETACQCGTIPSSDFGVWQRVRDIEVYMSSR